MVQLDRLESLPERLTQHEKLFNDMLHLIPAKYYINQKPEFNNNQYMHNKRKLKAPKQEIKERSKKARKAKLDPENEKSIAQVQEEQVAEAQREKQEEESGQDDDDDNDNNDDDEEEESLKGDFNGLQSAAEEKKQEEPVQAMKRTDIEDLHSRLQQRIADLRQQRNAPNAKSRDEILKQRAKKREDRKKAQAARKEKKGGMKAPAEELVQQQQSRDAKSAADSVKMDGDLFFGKVLLGQEKKKKGGVDAKQQLKKLEEKKQQLDQLRSQDKLKAAELEEKDQWEKALALATGEKIKDDTKLLKKTIKSKEQQKKKSGETWNKRAEKLKMDEKSKIKKREENIRQHTLAKKSGDKKGKKGGKPGKGMDKKKKARHGFEGAAFGYGGKVTKGKETKGKVTKGKKK